MAASGQVKQESVQDSQQQLQRLQKAREKAEELSREKSRLTGELGALQNQQKELEAKCKADFDCTIADLPGFISKLREESEAALVNAEVILGMREGEVKPAVVAPVPAKSAAPKTTASRMAALTHPVDEDGIP